MTNRKKILSNKVQIIAYSVIIAIIVIELFTRIFLILYIRSREKFPSKISPYAWNIRYVRDELKRRLFIFKEHKDTGWIVNPNIDTYFIYEEEGPIRIKTIELFDNVGVRDDGIIEGETFAVAVGDGYTFCDGLEIEDCWTEIIEKRIGKDVLNAGVSGYGTYQQYILLKKILRKYSFKLVLWQVTYVDYLKDMCFISRENCNIFSPNIVFLNNPKTHSILSLSSIYGLIKTLADIRDTRRIYAKMRAPETKYIQEIKDYCLNSGCRVLVIEPYRVPHGIRSPLCKNFKCISGPPGDEKYFFKNKHLNPDGNRYLAEAVIEALNNE